MGLDELKRKLEAFFDDPSTWMEYLDKCREANDKVNPDHVKLYAAIPPESRILDLGCGPGLSSKFLPNVEYFGFDFSTPALKAAKLEAGKNCVGFVRGNAMSLPYKNQSFDVVLSLRLIEYILRPQDFFLEIIRVLRPGGLLLLNGPGWEMPFQLPASMRNVVGLRRKRFILNRWARQVLHQILRHRTYFEIVPEIAATMDGNKESDDDALYIVSPYQIERFLRLHGMQVLHRQLDNDLDTWPRKSGLRYIAKKIILSFPPWQSGWCPCTIIAVKK